MLGQCLEGVFRCLLRSFNDLSYEMVIDLANALRIVRPAKTFISDEQRVGEDGTASAAYVRLSLSSRCTRYTVLLFCGLSTTG